jgi:hypothetical protein
MWFWSVLKLWREGLIAGLVISNMFLWIALDKKDDKVRDLNYELEKSATYSESLENSIVLQNEMIEELGQEREMYDELAEDAQEEIVAKQKQHRSEINAILNSQFGGTCPESIEWMIDMSRGRLKW